MHASLIHPSSFSAYIYVYTSNTNEVHLISFRLLVQKNMRVMPKMLIRAVNEAISCVITTIQISTVILAASSPGREDAEWMAPRPLHSS
jgi:2-phosphoglycerate kinase